MTPSAGGAAVELTPLKPLKRGKIDRAELVFDQVGSMWFLSEAWLPEGGGFQIFKPETSLDRKSVKAPKA